MAENENYSPIWMKFNPESEVKEEIKLEVTGTVPDWIDGSLYRNGSGVFQYGGDKINHLFDGMSVLLKFKIQDGRVMFQSKVLDTDAWNKTLKAQRLVCDQFSTKGVPDPCQSIFSRFFSIFKKKEPNDNTNVSVIERGDELWALTETPQMYRVDPNTLQQNKKVTMSNYVAVHLATAHPHTSDDGYNYNLGSCMKPSRAYNIIRIPTQPNGNLENEKAEIVATIPSRWKTMVGYQHSFGITENYFVILEAPFGISLPKLIRKKLGNSTSADCLMPCPGEKAIFYLIRKSNGELVKTKFEADPMFVFHFVNCYEEDGHVVVDIVVYDNVLTIKELYLSHLKGNCMSTVTPDSSFRRFVLPLTVKEDSITYDNLVTIESKATAVLQKDKSVFCRPDLITKALKEKNYFHLLASLSQKYSMADRTPELDLARSWCSEGVPMELPQINYDQFNGKKYQFVYGATIFSSKNQIVKLEVQTGELKVKEIENTHMTCEPIFLAKPGAVKEDEGVVLVPILACKEGTATYLLILDAESMVELARAEVPVENIVTFNFHGCFSKHKQDTDYSVDGR
ncbi:hypothetical protein LOTGIDRAFT_153552 [Lottia gigantea]|uniref:Uncharacterized protein n=1 Tax=Lottia gigantea TaxID=225164 RepID=V3ZIK6_LOTGI|nr:hypothetical protein LOTGIDRAFT_153552 [Lottia gigantea]ESO91118.1 hypothetical protein LOTGIDRAFT_153552 [Lottia gigantea]